MTGSVGAGAVSLVSIVGFPLDDPLPGRRDVCRVDHNDKKHMCSQHKPRCCSPTVAEPYAPDNGVRGDDVAMPGRGAEGER